MEIKQCTTCLSFKDLKEFGPKKSTKNGLEARCKTCRAKIERTNKYKISQEEIEQLAEKQQHCCAICGTNKPNGRTNEFVVDHCHNTGKVRGLLCHPCNSGIGMFKDEVDILNKAILYLTK